MNVSKCVYMHILVIHKSYTILYTHDLIITEKLSLNLM